MRLSYSPVLPLCSSLLLACTPLGAQSSSTPDYANAATWLCRPGRTDACAVDLSTSVVAASGAITTERFTAAAAPPIDCFYVYPTVSNDTTGNSDLEVGPEERAVVQSQFARFASVCRPFAPMYRQETLRALREWLAGRTIGSFEMAFQDVREAWRHYLTHDNAGRGVVLIGHSQGSRMLLDLIAKEIEGSPVQSRVVSAILAGWNVAVPVDRDVGGDFQHMPLCRTASQTGCIVSWVTFRDTLPPPPVALFGRVPTAGHEAACVNPAALAGSPTSLRGYLSSRTVTSIASVGPAVRWVAGGPEITTPFVAVPGMLGATCTRREGAHYLALTVNGTAGDPRIDDISGDIMIGASVQRAWGLHLIDMHVVMGDLIELVRRQGAAYRPGAR
jgi:hypothetical protein